MKKIFRLLFGMTLMAGLMTGCSSDDSSIPKDDLIVDYAPIVISVKVLSPEGYSILNAQNTQVITAVYNGKSYTCQSRATTPTRYYMPYFYGLSYQNDYLLFGELDGAKDYKDEQLILHWGGDLKPDTVTFSHEHDPNPGSSDKYAVAYNYLNCQLNGKPVDGEITIYKDLPTDKDAPDEDEWNGQDGVNGTSRKQMPLTQDQLALIKQVNAFGMILFNMLVQENQTKSIVASPLSLTYLLGMVANGAPEGSETEMEILKAMIQYGNNIGPSAGSPVICNALSAQLFNELFKTLITWAPQVDSHVKLELANALFTDQDFPVYAGYVNLLAKYYQADYANLDFASPEAIGAINSWASQKTHGLIPTIIDEIPGATVSYLLNALYFKAPWAMPFNPEHTRMGAFTLPNGTKENIPLMRNTLKTNYAQTERYTAVSLPFAKGAYWMDIFLPAEGLSIVQLAQEMNIQDIAWKEVSVILTLPRYEVSSDYKNLKDILQRLGIKRIFIPAAEFTELTPDDEFYISQIFQKARIIINETGGEAAAISGADGKDGSDSNEVTFTADRPFLYSIREASSGAIFFIGTYCGD